MPSYRAVLPIGDVLPGHRPEQVMETAELALGTLFQVAAKDIQVVARVPRIVLRYTVPASHRDQEDAEARRGAAALAEAVAEIAETGAVEVLRREHGRWLPVR